MGKHIPLAHNLNQRFPRFPPRDELGCSSLHAEVYELAAVWPPWGQGAALHI